MSSGPSHECLYGKPSGTILFNIISISSLTSGSQLSFKAKLALVWRTRKHKWICKTDFLNLVTIYLLWTWHKPIANCDNSGICLRISSVTRCTPRCCGLRFIFFWNHAELVWIILAEEAMFDLLSLSVASLNLYFVIQKQLSVKLHTIETLLPLEKSIIIMNKPLVIIIKTVGVKFKKM